MKIKPLEMIKLLRFITTKNGFGHSWLQSFSFVVYRVFLLSGTPFARCFATAFYFI